MLRSGFFNSQNHDRMYNATDFNELISTIKSDGIDNYGDKLEVSAGTGLSVLVSTGKCFFNNHWLYAESAYQIELEEASIVAPRIDAIVVEVNEVEREVFLKSVSGEPSNTPVPPSLVDSGSVHQHLLAYVDVPKEATSVSSITDKRSEWADVKSFKLDDVQEQITENIENGATASRTYNVGEYIVRGGIYYRVKSTIASGTSFVVGANIEKTSVGDEISTINSNLTDMFTTNMTLKAYTNVPFVSNSSVTPFVSICTNYQIPSADVTTYGTPVFAFSVKNGYIQAPARIINDNGTYKISACNGEINDNGRLDVYFIKS